MYWGSHFKISVIGPEEKCKSLQTQLGGGAHRIAVWSLSQVLALLADVGKVPDQIVILILTDEQQSIFACRLLLRHLTSTRLLLIYDYSHGSMLPASLTPLLDCLGRERPAKAMDASAAGGKAAGQGEAGQNPLSTREIEILHCLAHGHANKRIARELNITEATVKVHAKTILRKLNLANRTQAAIWAIQNGFAGELRDRAS